MSRKGIVFVMILLIGASVLLAQTFGVKKRRVRPEEFGNVVMNNFAERGDIAPVVFHHWLHRSKYTCRLCHVDLGFAMVAGETGVREDDIRNGFYCGACHNGEIAFAGEEKPPLREKKQHCVRCHSYGEEVDFEHDFHEFFKDFPKSRSGNRVDWLKAEEQELIQLQDYLEGVTIRRKPLKVPLETEIDAKIGEIPDIIFSHEKHTVWNGCELCHPEIFGIKKGGTRYEMQDNFNGKFCGACHGSVAFTCMDCQLCHTKEVL